MDLDAHSNAAMALPSSTRFASVVQAAVSSQSGAKRSAGGSASPAVARPSTTGGSTTLTINNTIVWLSSTNGRDKFYRVAHFLFKDFAWVFEKSLGKGSKAADSCDRIATGLMLGRRFFRIGSVPTAIQGILAARRETDPMLRFTALGSRASSLLFLVLDHASWMSRQGVFGMDYNQWVYYDCIFWLVSIVLQILYARRAYALAEQQQRVLRSQWFDAKDRDALSKDIEALDARMATLRIDFIRNLLDMPLALNGIFRPTRPAAIVFNIIGTASALVGSYQTWPK